LQRSSVDGEAEDSIGQQKSVSKQTRRSRQVSSNQFSGWCRNSVQFHVQRVSHSHPLECKCLMLSFWSRYSFSSSPTELLQLLAFHGPVASAVDATSWQDYLGGIVQFNCERRRNHAVQLIGFDLSTPIPFYIVKNSWGPEFGLSGYLHVAIGRNLCDIEKRVSAVDVL
jgi:hypothetical protein